MTDQRLKRRVETGRGGVRALYESIVDWYVEVFFEDYTDSDWLELFTENLPARAQVLDVGSGPGNFAKILQKSGIRVTCADLAIGMIATASRLVPQASRLVVDMRFLCLRAACFDGLLAAYSLLHVPGRETLATLSGFSDVLRPGGVLALMVKEGSGSYEIECTGRPGARGLVQLWGMEEIRSLLGTVGLQVFYMSSKEPSSAYELPHRKWFIMARRELGTEGLPAER